MVVQTERDIKLSKLLGQLKFKIDKCDNTYTTEVNKQLLIDCYDIIKTLPTEEDDAK